MGCRRPLSMEDRAAIGAGLESGLCQARIARMLGRSPSVISREIKRNAGADGCYRGEEAGRMAARRRARPKERAIDADPVLRSRVVSDLARGRTPRQISGRLKARSAWRGWRAMCWLPSSRWAHDQPRGDLHVDPHAIPGEEPRRSTGSCCPRRRGAQKWTPVRRVVSPPGRGHAVDRVGALTIDDRVVPGNWEDAA